MKTQALACALLVSLFGISYVEAPGGIRIELVEHTECAWGKAGE